MSDPTEPVPPVSAAPIGTAVGTTRYSVPEVARLLGISERAVRKRITAGTLDAHKEGNAWVVLLSATTGAVPAAPAAPEAVPSAAPEGGTGAAAVDLTPLVEYLERKDAEIRRLSDALAGWQFRALRAEEKIEALEAGPIAGDTAGDAAVTHEGAPVSDDAPVRVSESLIDRLRRLLGRV
jgi:hypothetical protein